jgi:exosortase B
MNKPLDNLDMLAIYKLNFKNFISENAILIIGIFALVVPTIYDLAQGLWQTDEQGHGPLILLIIAWLFWQKKEALAALEPRSNIKLALLVMIPTLFSYIFGRSQGILLLEIGAFIPLAISIFLLSKGLPALKVIWFCLLFMVFLIPLPGPIVDALTVTLKGQISHIAEFILYGVGYPVARSGVLITIGQYQLLVADACSGLHSMFSLLAVGLLYIYITNHTSRLRNVFLVLLIIPMAFIANVIRVITLIVVTYHFGDAAGQGFIHDFAGMALFSFALIGMFLFDAFFGLFLADKVLEK